MPTYDYRCPNGHEFERFFRKISDAPADVACPDCGAPGERRVSGGAGLLFKGSGFYLTDYGKNAHRKPGPDGKATSKSGETSSGGDGGSATGGAAEPGGASKGGESKPESPAPSSGKKGGGSAAGGE